MNTANAIDFDHLHTYTAGDGDLEREVLGLFCQQVDIWLRMLEDSADNDHWKDAAHSLKGTARAIGAKTVAQLCLDAESLGENDNEDARRAILKKIRVAVADAVECADHHLSGIRAD